MADSAVPQKNIDVSRRDEMLHRQKVFWVLFYQTRFGRELSKVQNK
jgi:hypothetical protein